MSLNTLILTGNLGSDPRFTVTTTGRKKAAFSIASTKSLKAADGSWTKTTEWTPVVLWGRLADRAEKLLVKGIPVLVHGEKRTRSYTDAKGHAHQIVELVAADFQVLARRQEGA
ncbi:MAG: ssb [Holophagaceae bacterium]|nr:ssb [Holophagaceae bacterium]